MEALGTRGWAATRQGRLSGGERLKMGWQGLRAVWQARAAAQLPELAVEVTAPSTEPARAAEALLVATSAPWLQNHGHRAYAWALALAARDGLRPDREILYTACLLHDLGITERFLPPPGECFAVFGADAAEQALVEAGMPRERAARAAEAIALHLNLVVPAEEHGVEAMLLRAGTALDVVGQDFHRVGEAFRTRTLGELPRLGFKREVRRAIAAQAARSPGTRIAFLCGPLSLLARVDAAPFAE